VILRNLNHVAFWNKILGDRILITRADKTFCYNKDGIISEDLDDFVVCQANSELKSWYGMAEKV
jgi:hypothetical protein